MRFDQWATHSFFYPWAQLGSSWTGFSIPILMYHAITDDPETPRHPYFSVNTPPAVFDVHMHILKQSGYQSISLNAANQFLHHSSQKPSNKYVVITFDDGFLDFYTAAVPILRKYHFTAEVFLPTQFMNGHFQNRACLHWDDIRALRREGFFFGSHTVSHPELVHLDRTALLTEWRDSKKKIEDELSETVSTFAYPFAFPEAQKDFVAQLEDVLIECGYAVGATTAIGRARRTHNPLFLRRLPMNGFDDRTLFQAKLAGGYDWVGKIQYISKKLRRNV